MKILLTSDWPVSAVNGVAVSVKNLYRGLKDLGHDVRVLTLSDNNDFYREGDFYHIKSFDLPLYPDLKGTVKFRSQYVRELIEWRPDIVHSQCEFFTYSMARIIAYRCQAPIAHTYHTMYDHYASYIKADMKVSKAVLKRAIARRLRDADLVFAPTEKVYKALKGWTPAPIVVMPTGIDLDKFYQDLPESRLRDLRESYHIGPDQLILLSLGRIAQEKNLDEAILNFKSLGGQVRGATYLIVGGGPYLKKLKDLVREEGLDGRVIFTGQVDPEMTPYYYRMADIFISASVSESQGLTYIEAMASGLVPFCRQDEALEGLVKDGHNGYTFKCQASYQTKLLALIENESLREALAARALEASKAYSIEAFAERALYNYQEAIDNFKSRRPSPFLRAGIRL